MPSIAIHKKNRRSRMRAFTLTIIPNSGEHVRQWRISFSSIYFILALCFILVGVLIFSILRQKPVNTEKMESSELASAWIARWELLETGKNEIRKNLDKLKEIGDEYFKTIFKIKTKS